MLRESVAQLARMTVSRQCWLMKAEPESRLERGQDIAFSVDMFMACPHQTTSWEGVRNTEAKNMMKEKMKIGDDVLFYHSSCKLPGIVGLAKVVKEGYPDFTAWDPTHPYYDPKTVKSSPKWFMVDVKLQRKLPHLVPLALLQHLASSERTESLPYLDKAHIDAISSMQLLNRGRLSVQQAEPKAFEAITLLGDRGGWQDWPGKWNVKTRRPAKVTAGATSPRSSQPSGKREKTETVQVKNANGKRVSKASETTATSQPALRRSKRNKS